MVASYDNYEWFINADLSGFAGKWIAIVDKEVVASGGNASHVLHKAKEKFPRSRPFLTKVTNTRSVL